MARRRILVLSPEPIRKARTGVAIRLTEIARHLALEHEVTLAAPSVEDGLGLPFRLTSHSPPSIASLAGACDVIIAHGHVSNELLSSEPRAPLVFDLYDPFVIENLAYAQTLGPAVFRYDRLTVERQLKAGDFFLVASEVQRAFYLGMLTILGRVNPGSYQKGRDLRHLVSVVPFGVASGATPPPRTGALRQRLGVGQEPVVMFGGVYDWYDAGTAIDAMAMLKEDGSPAFLVLVSNPNQESTPQTELSRALERARERKLEEHVRVIPWVPYDERGAVLADADLGLVTHREGIETMLSFRTRVLDLLWAGVPVVATEGGGGSELIARCGAGRLVPPADARALAQALRAMLDDAAGRRAAGMAGSAYVQEHLTWERVLAPLTQWLREPAPDHHKPAAEPPARKSPWSFWSRR